MIKSLLFIMKTLGQVLTTRHTPKVLQIELKSIFSQGTNWVISDASQLFLVNSFKTVLSLLSPMTRILQANDFQMSFYTPQIKNQVKKDTCD